MFGTVVSGAMNSILTKYQDMQCVRHCSDPSRAVYFDQPILQTLQMFIGEMFCWIPIIMAKQMQSRSDRNESVRLVDDDTVASDVTPKWKRSISLAIPAICDLLATTLMNVGLLYTPVSIYQMTRGSVILIVGLMSVIFLKRRITKLEWLSLFVVFLGVFLVGLSGYLEDQGSARILTTGDNSFDVIIGMFLVFCGITITAVQFVIEEHILTYLKVEPIEVVGYQGFYGALITFHAMIFGKILYGKGYFDIDRSFEEMFSNKTVLYTSIMIMFSISIFNFCGITLTKILSATSRSTIDTSRTLLVWMISLSVGWEKYHNLQLLAFSLLVAGTLSFNGVIQPEEWSIIPEWLKDFEIEVPL